MLPVFKASRLPVVLPTGAPFAQPPIKAERIPPSQIPNWDPTSVVLLALPMPYPMKREAIAATAAARM